MVIHRACGCVCPWTECLSAARLEPVDNVRATLQSSQRREPRRLPAFTIINQPQKANVNESHTLYERLGLLHLRFGAEITERLS